MWWRAPDVRRLAERQDADRLGAALDHRRPEVRAEAAAALAAVDPTGCVEPLRRVLVEDPEPAVRAAAGAALCRAGTGLALDAVGGTAMTSRAEPAVRSALDALAAGAREDDRCVAQMSRVVRHAALPPMRVEAVRALATLDSVAALAALDAALTEDSAAVRAAAVAALEARLTGLPEEPGHDPARPPLRLSSHAPQVVRSTAAVPEDLQARCAVAGRRWQWARALGSVAVPPLTEALESLGPEQADDRRAAALALARIDDPRVVPVVVALLEAALDEDLAFAGDLVEALASTPRGVGGDLAERVVRVALDVVLDAGGATRARAEQLADARAAGLRTWEERRRIDPVDDLNALQAAATGLLDTALRSWPVQDPRRHQVASAALARIEGVLSALGVPESLQDAYEIADDSDARYHELAAEVRRAEGMHAARNLVRRAAGG